MFLKFILTDSGSGFLKLTSYFLRFNPKSFGGLLVSILSASGTSTGLIVDVHSVVLPWYNSYSFFSFLYFSLSSRVCYCWFYSVSSPKLAFFYCCYNNLVSFVYKVDTTSFFTFYFSMLVIAFPKFGDG